MAMKDNANKRLEAWTAVPGAADFKIIGDSSRFSISIDIAEDIVFGVNGCRIMTGKKGDFISYPAWKDDGGKYHDYCYLKLPKEITDSIISMLQQ